jgi:hypothetical protein
MDQMTLRVLARWQTFYEIAGSSAGALTGLQFVVMTLVTQARGVGNHGDIRAFGTPTVIHLCSALLLSAIMTAPWQSVSMLGACLLACGVCGSAYSLRVFWHARQARYKPDAEDWLWYLIFPFIGHVALLASAVLTYLAIPWSLAAIAVDVLFFLLLGVRNAWDTVTYIAMGHSSSGSKSDSQSGTVPRP